MGSSMIPSSSSSSCWQTEPCGSHRLESHHHHRNRQHTESTECENSTPARVRAGSRHEGSALYAGIHCGRRLVEQPPDQLGAVVLQQDDIAELRGGSSPHAAPLAAHLVDLEEREQVRETDGDRKSTRLNSSH